MVGQRSRDRHCGNLVARKLLASPYLEIPSYGSSHCNMWRIPQEINAHFQSTILMERFRINDTVFTRMFREFRRLMTQRCSFVQLLNVFFCKFACLQVQLMLFFTTTVWNVRQFWSLFFVAIIKNDLRINLLHVLKHLLTCIVTYSNRLSLLICDQIPLKPSNCKLSPGEFTLAGNPCIWRFCTSADVLMVQYSRLDQDLD